MKQTVKMFVQYNLTTGEWVDSGQWKAHRAGELSLSPEKIIESGIDYQRWYGIKVNVMELDVVIDVPDDVLIPLIKGGCENAEESVRKQMKELEAKFFMEKAALESQLKGLLAIEFHPGDNAKEVKESHEGEFISAAGNSSGDRPNSRFGDSSEADDAEITEGNRDDDNHLEIPF